MCPAHDRLPRTDSHPRIPPACQASAPRASVFCFISAHVCSGADILRALGSNAGLRSSAVCKIPSQRLQVIDFPGQFPCAQLSAQVPQPYSLLSSPSSKFLFLLIHQACPVSMAGPATSHILCRSWSPEGKSCQPLHEMHSQGSSMPQSRFTQRFGQKLGQHSLASTAELVLCWGQL